MTAPGTPTAAAGWVDSHCHVYDADDPQRADDAVAEAAAAGVDTLVVVGCDRATSLAALELAARHRRVHATVGLHPHEARHGVDTIIDLFDSGGGAAPVAVGECGLDYHYDHSPRPTQRDVFAAQIAIANERHLPLVIHTREAWDETFEVLDREGIPERTVFHCFTGGAAEAAACLARGGYLSFSGILTFNSASDVRAAAISCPLERTLVETDSPYLAPVPHRGRPNRPALVPVVGAALAELHGVDVEAIRTATANTATTVFAVPR